MAVIFSQDLPLRQSRKAGMQRCDGLRSVKARGLQNAELRRLCCKMQSGLPQYGADFP